MPATEDEPRPDDADTRRHFRLRYPPRLAPQFICALGELDVVDLSEGGVRLDLGRALPPEPDTVLEGVVRVRRGEEVPVRGTVVWRTTQRLALAFEVGVPFRVMLEEQRWLQARRHDR